MIGRVYVRIMRVPGKRKRVETVEEEIDLLSFDGIVTGIRFESGDETIKIEVRPDGNSIEIFADRAIFISPDASNHLHLVSRD